jgi:RNA polymerase sigma-70 factor (ECF subfamily)
VADDLVQQLWLKLLEAARSGRFLPSDDAAVRSYLFTAARNLFLDECVRKHASSRTVSHDPQVLESLMSCDADFAGRSADELLEDEQRRVAVAAAIAHLSPPQRTVIRLWMSDTSIESMAVATGAPRDTVLSRKKYALHSLRARLGAALG